MNSTDAAIGKWDVIFEFYGLPGITSNNHVKCPLCEREKFRCDDKNGTGSWICVCGHGDGWSLLMNHTGKKFGELASEVNAITGNQFDKVKQEVNHVLNNNMILWKKCLALKGTMGEQYLNHRGIYSMPTGGVKFTQAIYDKALDKTFTGLFSIASNEAGIPIFRHTTYFGMVDPKLKKLLKLKEYTGSVAIKLHPAQTTLGIAEGIETALSCTQLYKLPVWSVLNAPIMKKFRAPPEVEHLIIYADNDKNGTGLAAALECGNRNILKSNSVTKVTIRWTKNHGDFNDLLKEECEVLTITLTS